MYEGSKSKDFSSSNVVIIHQFFPGCDLRLASLAVMNAIQCRPALGGACLPVRAPVVVAPRRALVIQNAHKKGAGSTKNGRDSNPKFRGVKVYGGQPIHPGGIIVRQLGNKVRLLDTRCKML